MFFFQFQDFHKALSSFFRDHTHTHFWHYRVITFTSLFLHTSLIRVSSIISRHLIILDSLAFARFVKFRPLSNTQPKALQHKARASTGVTFCDSSSSFVVSWWKIFCWYIIFWESTHYSWSHFLLCVCVLLWVCLCVFKYRKNENYKILF